MRGFILGTALVALVGAAACYNPSFQNGALACGGSSGVECPDGYFCDKGACWKKGTPISPTAGTSGGSSGPGGMSGSGGGGTGGADAMLYGPFDNCAATSSGRCDPVCQAGCGRGERCNFENSAPVCRAQPPPFKDLLDECDPNADACRPGTICLSELDPDRCRAHCYKYCRSDRDCPSNARCAVDVQIGNTMTTYKVCSPPVEPACNPVSMGTNPARCQTPRANFGCYVLSARYPDLSVCDCAGTKPPQMPCQFEHECVPGWECVNLGGESICRKVCNLTMPVSGCATGQVCTPFVSSGTPSTRYGFCRQML